MSRGWSSFPFRWLSLEPRVDSWHWESYDGGLQSSTRDSYTFSKDTFRADFLRIDCILRTTGVSSDRFLSLNSTRSSSFSPTIHSMWSTEQLWTLHPECSSECNSNSINQSFNQKNDQFKRQQSSFHAENNIGYYDGLLIHYTVLLVRISIVNDIRMQVSSEGVLQLIRSIEIVWEWFEDIVDENGNVDRFFFCGELNRRKNF